MPKPKLIRITTVPGSFDTLLKGQLGYMTKYFNVLGITSPGKRLKSVRSNEKVDFRTVKMYRRISPFQDIISLFRMYKILIKEKPDIVHTHTPKAGFIGMIASVAARVPCRIHTVAGLPLLETGGIKFLILKLVEKIVYKCAHRVHINSIELKKHIINLKLVKKNKIDIILNGSSNGIDTSYFSKSKISDYMKAELKSELNINNEDFIFCYVGRVVRDKGINELVNAFEVLNNEFKNIKLLLVGQEESDLDPIELDTKNKIQNNINIITVGYKNDIRSYLAISDLFVFPSYREGFPNVVMQACSMEINCIVTDINGCNELINHNINGVIIKPKSVKALINKMKFFFLNQDINNKFSKKGRSNICLKYERLEFWKELRNQYLKLLSSVNIQNKKIITK
tara:strand:+ start:509 stop:1699 length:1191 start_codon:yes stop_codon:yes gene_type:complete